MRLLLLLLSAAALLAQSPAAPKPGFFEGTVVNSATRAPVPKARVSVGSKGVSRAGVTDESGRFQIANLEPGSWRVDYVEARGYLYQPHIPPDFTVAEDQRVAGVVLELTPLGVITGKIVDEDGDPMEGAQVAVMQYTYGNGARSLHTVDGAVTDDRGAYRVFHLKPGRYFVNAWLPPGQMQYGVLQKDWLPANTHRNMAETGYLPVFYPNGPDPTQATALELAPGGELDGVDFRLRSVPVFHIRGRLVGAPSDRPASVLATPCPAPDGSAEYGAKVQSDGRFDIAGVSKGVYCLSLSQVGFKRTVYATDTVTVNDRSLDGIALRGIAAFPISGTLKFDGLTGDAPEAVVFVAPVSGSGLMPNNALVGDDGSYVLEGSVPGSYHVWVNRLPPNFYLKSVQFGTQEVPDGLITIRPGAAALSLVVGCDAGQVSGTVQAADGSPAAGVEVTIVPTGPGASRIDLLKYAPTDRNGHFQLGGLPPGDYQAYAWEDMDVPVTLPEFRQEFAGRAGEVTIASGASTSVQLKLIPANEIAKVKARF